MAVTADVLKRYRDGQEIFRRRSVGLLVAEIEQQRASLEQAMKALRHIQEMAEEDIELDLAGTNLYQIEADARAAMKVIGEQG